ncbi:MAG: diguanylate cyclase, partial [Burkholderiales bacterium]|nr:diguanylate cyclase [Burkholderiales bacterium]
MLAVLCIGALLMTFAAKNASAMERVTLQLKWTHAFQFAGYYAAKELGYYRDAGLDVSIKEAPPGISPVDEVLSGRANFGVGTSGLLLARNDGKPVVVLAVIFQHSPQILISRRFSPVQSVDDLVGKRMMLERQSEELLAFLKHEGIPLDRIRLMEHSLTPQDLMDDKTDVISAYSTYELYELNQAKFPYQIYSPRSAGIDFYGDNLFTSESELQDHPDRVRAFRAASLKGWEYAMANPDKIIDLILSHYTQNHTKAFFQFESAQMVPLLRSDLLTIGYMNPGRWRHIADTYAELGMLPANFPLDGFLYDANPEADGRLKWFYFWTMITLVIAGGVAGVAWYIFRVNRRLAVSLEEIQQTQLRLKLLSMAVEQSPTSVLITGADSVIEYVNPNFTKETGYSSEEAIGKTPKILQSGMTPTSTYRELWQHLLSGKIWTGQLVNRRKSGEIYWEEAHIAPVKNAKGETTHYVAVKLDITERKQASDRLAHMAHHDVLTNLPNRILFFERVTQGLALAKRHQTLLALMFIDLDNFKPINDNFGHATGDLILQEVAKRMTACLRESDTVGRIGGDEFVALLLDVGSEESAVKLADKIRSALKQGYTIENQTHYISSSIGIAMYPEHGENDLELAKNADFAMYHAKASGRDIVKVFHKTIP